MAKEYEEGLKKLGLTEAEAKVYISTLQLGGGYVSLIAKKSEVERTNCYHILKTLGKKGFISITNRGSSKYFLPESPKKIINEQEDMLMTAQKIVPSLISLQNTPPGLAPQMKYYEGLEGVRNVFNQCLESKTEILSYTNIHQLLNKFPKVMPSYCLEKAERKLKTRIISPYNKASENFLYEYFPDDYISKFIQLLYINPEEFALQNDITIFDDKVSIVSLSPDENIGVIIESKVYADTSRTIFNLSWLGATSFVAR